MRAIFSAHGKKLGKDKNEGYLGYHAIREGQTVSDFHFNVHVHNTWMYFIHRDVLINVLMNHFAQRM